VPYKDPERKRQWEREHRQERSARRKLQRIPARSGESSMSSTTPDRTSMIVARLKKQVCDPVPQQQPTSGWKVLLGVALGLGVLVLAAIAGINLPPPSIDVHPGSGAAGM